MTFVDIPSEQTTAVTDGILALLALGGLVLLLRLRLRAPQKVTIWAAAFLCLLVASAAGAVVHGVEVGPRGRHLLWLVIYLSLGLLVAFFAVGTLYDLRGERAARRMAPVMVVIAILFFGVTQLIDGAFVVFVIYEAAALSFAMLGYLWLGLIRRRPGAGLMTAGILVTLTAAVIQATRLVPQISVVWTFDHNGLFHIVQMLGVVLIVAGLRAGMLHEPVGRD
ncbi:MAG: DUF6962 family protein [Geminicoccaceae bacterium]